MVFQRGGWKGGEKYFEAYFVWVIKDKLTDF